MTSHSAVTLPDNFMDRVLDRARTKCTTRSEAVQEAIIEVLGRPLTDEEKWAMIDAAANNSPGVKLNQGIIDRISGGGRK